MGEDIHLTGPRIDPLIKRKKNKQTLVSCPILHFIKTSITQRLLRALKELEERKV